MLIESNYILPRGIPVDVSLSRSRNLLLLYNFLAIHLQMLGPLQTLVLMAVLGSLSRSQSDNFSDERTEAVRRLEEGQLRRQQDPTLQTLSKRSFGTEQNYPIFKVSNDVRNTDNYNFDNYIPKGRESRVVGPDDDVTRRQSRIVDYTRPTEYGTRLSETHKPNSIWGTRENIYSPNRLPSVIIRDPSVHPDGDALMGRRELPLDDPVGLHAQRQEIQSREIRRGQSSIVGYLSRLIHRSPRTSLPRSAPEYHEINLDAQPEKKTVATGVGTIIKALLSSN